MKRVLWLGFVVSVYLICTGCGDTFRPIIIPNPPVFPNPEAAHTVLTINDNGTFVAGSGMVIDVSGDTAVSAANTDIHPVNAVQQAASTVLVVNQEATSLDQPLLPVPTSSCNVTINVGTPQNPVYQVYDVCPSITKLNFNGTTIGSSSNLSLPPYSGSNFVAVAPSATLAFVTMPTYPPDPTNPQTIVPSVGLINTLTNTSGAPVPVVPNPPSNANPYALAVTPNNTKLYVANDSTPCNNPPVAGICSISAFNINITDQTLSPRGLVNASGQTPVLSSPPIWLAPRSDSQMVYVLEATTGTLGYITITSTAGPDVFTESGIAVPGAVKMTYDLNLNRLYIAGESQVAIVDVSQSVPVVVATIIVTPFTAANRTAGDPCAATTVTTLNTVDVAALPDGSRAYAGTYYEAAIGGVNYICPQVTVINTVSNTAETPPIAIPGFTAYDAFCGTNPGQRSARFRIMMAAGGDSSRAYLSSCDGGMVNIIYTSSETYALNLPAPVGTLPPVPPDPLNPPQNPVFLIAGP